MERILDENERIRRAEEIACRRNYIREKDICNKKSKTYLGSKILLELLILINIFVIVYAVKNKDEIFKEEFLAKITINEFNIKEKINELYNNLSEDSVFVEENQNKTTEEKPNETSEEKTNEIAETSNIEALGGNAEITNIIIDNESDTDKIKKMYNLIKPLDGTVTSSFGMRQSSNDKINGYHTGTDIAANLGTEILATVDGKISLVSNYGDYGKHLKLSNGDIEFLYAHCLEILVNEGDTVKQGQAIAKVRKHGK